MFDNVSLPPIIYRCREGSLTVTAATLKHRIPCFGYVITEDQLPGKYVLKNRSSCVCSASRKQIIIIIERGCV